MRLESGSQKLIQVYEKRKARIVVNPTPQVATTIFAIANEEAKALYVKQPYSDILMHLRSQWIFNKSPSKPLHGATEGSTSRANWDVSKNYFLSYTFLLNKRYYCRVVRLLINHLDILEMRLFSSTTWTM